METRSLFGRSYSLLLILTGVCLIAVCLTQTGARTDADKSQQTYALLVGINDYESDPSSSETVWKGEVRLW